jgi:putative DNA primase/helicase
MLCALDNWTPLAAIAEIAGGEWLSRCADAYQKLTPQDEGEAVGAMLLEDIQKVFQERGVDRIWCCDLVDALNEMEERPWPEWKHGRPMTTRSLAKQLKAYQIKSEQIKDGFKNRNGFRLDQFTDAFDRYLAEK